MTATMIALAAASMTFGQFRPAPAARLLPVRPEAQMPAPIPQPVQAVYINAVTSTPRVGATVPVGEVATVTYRLRLSDGRELTDFTGLPFVIQALQRTGENAWTDVSQELKCNLAVGQCAIGSGIPRIVTIQVTTPGLGNTLTTISFFQPNRGGAAIDVTASAAQANDGNIITLSATSPITYTGWVNVHARTSFTDIRESFESYIYLPEGVKYGQKIQLNIEEVRPMSFRDRRFFEVTFQTANGVIAQGFGSSVGKMEYPNVDAAIDDNGDLVFSTFGGFDPSVDYTITLLRNDGFRVELSTVRNELYAYPFGNRTKLVFNKFSLAGNQFYLDGGSYTINLQGRDRTNGIGWSASRADALVLDHEVVLQ